MSFLPLFSLETWALVLVFFGLLLLYGIWPYSFFKKLGIPGPKPLPFIGTLHRYQNGLIDFDTKCHQKYGKIWGFFDGRQPMLAIMDPTLIKSILVKDFYNHFPDRRDFGLVRELDNIIFTAPDAEWKRIRTVLSPNFTSGRLKEMMPIINHYGEMLVKNIQKKMENNESIDTKDIFGAYSMDVVTSTSFGIDVDSINNPRDPFVMNIKKMLNFSFLNPLIVLTVVFPFLKPLLEKLNVSLVPPSSIIFFSAVMKKIKMDREKNNLMRRVDFLQLMLDSQISGDISVGGKSYKALTDKEILTQSISFIFASYETTSSTLGYLSYTLATHPDVQQKVQEEIDRIFPNQATPTYDAIFQMEYLDMVINENLRIYTSAVRIERVCKSPIEINGMKIPKGTVVIIPISVLHRDPEYWPEPEEFRPERFSKENKDSIDPYVFLPFGVGPRNCIGMRFALLVLKMVMVVLLQRFSFRTCKETLKCLQKLTAPAFLAYLFILLFMEKIPLELESKGFLQAKQPIRLRFVPREAAGFEE